MMRAEADARVGSEHILCKQFKHSLEVAHRDAAINDKSLELVEERRMRRVNIVGTVNAPGRDDADRRLLLFHYSDLHGRGL